MNEINVNNFINKEIHSESSLKAYNLMFNSLMSIEEELDKQSEKFNKEDLDIFIKHFCTSKTHSATRVKFTLLRNYFKFIGNKHIDKIREENLIDLINQANETQYERYISKEDLIKLCGRLENNSDKCLLMLIRNGIGIEYEVEDLIKLTRDDIDFKNNKIHNKNIDSYTMELVDKTFKEREYISLGAYEKLVVYNMSSPYLFKTRRTKTTDDGMKPFKVSGIRGRLQRIKAVLKNDERVVLSNLILSYVVDLIIEKENELKRDLSLMEMKIFLNEKIGSSKNIYDIKCMVREVKNIVK